MREADEEAAVGVAEAASDDKTAQHLATRSFSSGLCWAGACLWPFE